MADVFSNYLDFNELVGSDIPIDGGLVGKLCLVDLFISKNSDFVGKESEVFYYLNQIEDITGLSTKDIQDVGDMRFTYIKLYNSLQLLVMFKEYVNSTLDRAIPKYLSDSLYVKSLAEIITPELVGVVFELDDTTRYMGRRSSTMIWTSYFKEDVNFKSLEKYIEHRAIVFCVELAMEVYIRKRIEQNKIKEDLSFTINLEGFEDIIIDGYLSCTSLKELGFHLAGRIPEFIERESAN